MDFWFYPDSDKDKNICSEAKLPFVNRMPSPENPFAIESFYRLEVFQYVHKRKGACCMTPDRSHSWLGGSARVVRRWEIG